MPEKTRTRAAKGPKAAPPPFQISADLKGLIESGVAVLVASGDAGRRPHVVLGWGPRVRSDRSTIDVFLDAPRSAQTLSNAAGNGHIAMTVADPVSYRSAQFKGCFVESAEASADDVAWVGSRREAFVVSTSLIGDPPEAIRGMWMDAGLVRLTFRVERAFDQTPGPGAGKPL